MINELTLLVLIPWLKMEETAEGLFFYACPYTAACRQAVTDKQSGVAVHLVDGNWISVKIMSVNANIGIHSIVAIPVEEWSLDFIKPKPVCMQKNGTCISSTYFNPPDSKKIQFEGESGQHPIHKISNTTTYVQLNPLEDMIDLHGKVSSPGTYRFVVQYYQPEFAGFDLSVILQNGEFYEATLPAPHCPSPSGCRSLVTEHGGNTKFALTENFMITLKQPDDKSVYLDYLLIIQDDFFTPRILEEDTLDRSGEFIATCGSNNFNIDTKQEGFCRDSVFSITAAHNNGALPCQCDFEGSLSFECDKFGGQCPCKPNIIGRQCEACKTGYYGFPDCKPCNCPSTALCETSTGRCICPTHVTGERCDQCVPFTYGYDPIIGCEECQCNALGVQQDLQCNLLNGSCTCKNHIMGRKCDSCEAGYFLFPYCEPCECDLRGTRDEICDQASAECLCKSRVTGPACRICKEGSFNLQGNNEEGCTECFCFGKTTRCSSSNLIQTFLLIMDSWSLVTINETFPVEVAPLNVTLAAVGSNSVGVDFTAADVKNKLVYFSAPKDYLGAKLTAYGGYLNYTIFYTIEATGKAVNGPDVVLQGAGTFLIHRSLEQPAAVQDYTATLQLVESNFQFLTGIPAKREHIMAVLHDLEGVYIRASYWTDSITTKLSNASIDDAVPYHYISGNPRSFKYATSVEQCQCPPGYSGLSCELCAPGYYRISSGPHGGYCIPCQCNGHATECDVDTGVCLNCDHHTMGDHCDLCAVGYHGNAVQGTPMDCLICACPLPIPSNNFATSCEVSSDGEKISCDCVEGYYGARCQSCAPGYFGRPEMQGEICRPCECSGNINPAEPGSCDTVSGDCLRCLNNTFGESCALCAPGFYGDAIQAKNCQPCLCDPLGTAQCNSYTGQCQCKPNVVGEKCDRCELEHYGFQSGRGCIPCACGLASLSAQCDDVTGQCMCKPGVAGRACDRCAPGFWNYKEQGCDSCGCKTEYSRGFGCNAETGHCECLPGVVGEKCDQCPHRWAFIPDVGCHQCDSCTDDLLDDTDLLHYLLRPYLLEFDSVDSGYFTAQRLAHINQTLFRLKPKVKQLNSSAIDLTPIIQELESLEQDSENMKRKANYSTTNSKDLATKADNLREDALVVLEAISQAAQEAQDAIENIENLSESLLAGEGPKIDAALQEAQNILDGIKIYNLTGRETDASNQLEKATELIRSLRDFKKPVDDVGIGFKELKTELKVLNDKIDDLYNHTQYSSNKAMEAENFHMKSGKELLEKKLENIADQKQDVEKNLELANQLILNATKYLNDAQKAYSDIENDPESLEKENTKLNETLEQNALELIDIQDKLSDVQTHAEKLSKQAEELDNLFTESRNISENAVKAAKAYANIVEAVQKAYAAAETGKEAAANASQLLADVADSTITSSKISDQLLGEADQRSKEAVDNLRPKLEEAKAKSRPVRGAHDKNNQTLTAIENFLKDPHIQFLRDKLVNASNTATEADNLAQATLDRINTNFKPLPEDKEASLHLPNKLEDATRNISNAQKQVRSVNERLPQVIQDVSELPVRQQKARRLAAALDDKINHLKEQISLARDVANRIKVGVKFFKNTTLELRNPPNMDDLSTSTYISGYFKTKEPNGLIFYLGNVNGTKLPRTDSNDFMALEVENGYLVLTLDVGNGPQRIIHDKPVADDTWYQFIVDRTAHHAKLIVREELPGGEAYSHVKGEELQGTKTIFNLDRNQSKFFVGGYPPQHNLQAQVRQNSFEGEIEDLAFDKVPVSLWNFNDGNENNHGAISRNKLVDYLRSTGYRFNGNGYTIIDARPYYLKNRFDIQLTFKTFEPNGLLFLVQGDNSKTFTSLELQDGRVIYQYNLGQGTKKWVTSRLYNDGNWHTLDARRENANGRFTVDGEDVADHSPPVGGQAIEPFDKFFFGGHPQRHGLAEVTMSGFDGCIDNVTITKYSVDLSENVKAYGVTPGCPEKFARMVSWDASNLGYVRDNFSASDLFQINLKFKTDRPDGLIFFAVDQFGNEGVSLALVNGRLILICQKILLDTPDGVSYNDNQWHVVGVTHNKSVLRLDVDDVVQKMTDSSPPPIRIMYGDIFFGGVPENYDVKKGMVGTSKGFAGCIIDASRNGNLINFANYTVKKGEHLGKCIQDQEHRNVDSGVHRVPTLGPIQPLGVVTARPPEVKTREPPEAGIPKRGDGGRDGVARATEPSVERPRPTPPAPVTKKPPTPPKVKPGTVPPAVKPPSSAPSCALPMVPAIDITKASKSFRYAANKQSRSEYHMSRGKVKRQFDFTLEFKTAADEGILLYIRNANDQHYAALYLQEGHVVFTFNGGAGPAVLTSQHAYNDDDWHSVNISRAGSEGRLTIDDKVVAEGRTPGDTSTISLNTPYYVGGVSQAAVASANANLKTSTSLSGCIRNFHMNGYPMDDPTSAGVSQCLENVEEGAFFGSRGGYLKLKDKFRVGIEIDIKMKIKPRNVSGLLIAVQGKKDFLVLELVNGVLNFTVENGKGAIYTSFQPDKLHYFCDGLWHDIQAVKSKNVVTLSVDSTFTDPGVGDYRSQSTDTGGSLFLGGHKYINKARGLVVRAPYVGCIKELQINENPFVLEERMAEGDVIVGSCPTI